MLSPERLRLLSAAGSSMVENANGEEQRICDDLSKVSQGDFLERGIPALLQHMHAPRRSIGEPCTVEKSMIPSTPNPTISLREFTRDEIDKKSKPVICPFAGASTPFPTQYFFGRRRFLHLQKKGKDGENSKSPNKTEEEDMEDPDLAELSTEEIKKAGKMTAADKVAENLQVRMLEELWDPDAGDPDAGDYKLFITNFCVCDFTELYKRHGFNVPPSRRLYYCFHCYECTLRGNCEHILEVMDHRKEIDIEQLPAKKQRGRPRGPARKLLFSVQPKQPAKLARKMPSHAKGQRKKKGRK